MVSQEVVVIEACLADGWFLIEASMWTVPVVPKLIPNAVEIVEGTASAPGAIVLFSFPSMALIKTFLDDPDYAPYRNARIAATEATSSPSKTMTMHHSS